MSFRTIEVFQYKIPTNITSEPERTLYDQMRDLGDILDIEGSDESRINQRIRTEFPSFIDIQECDFAQCVKINKRGKSFVLVLQLPHDLIKKRIDSDTMSILDKTSITIEIIQFAKRENSSDLVGRNVPSMPIYNLLMNRLIDPRYTKLTTIQRKYILNKIEMVLNRGKNHVRRVTWENQYEFDNISANNRITSTETQEVLTNEVSQTSVEIGNVPVEEWNGSELSSEAVLGEETNSPSNRPRRSQRNSPQSTEDNTPSNQNSQQTSTQENNPEQELSTQETIKLLVLSLLAAGTLTVHGYVAIELANYITEIWSLSNDSLINSNNIIPLVVLAPIALSSIPIFRRYLSQKENRNTPYENLSGILKDGIISGVAVSMVSNLLGGRLTGLFNEFIEYQGIYNFPLEQQWDLFQQKTVEVLKVIGLGAGALAIFSLILSLKERIEDDSDIL